MKNKVLTLLLSLAISFGLWLYVVTVISPESEKPIYKVPVEVVGSSYLDAQNLILVSPTEGLYVDLTLGGSRSDLAKLNNSNVTVIVDLSKIKHPGEHHLDYSVSYQSGSAEVLKYDSMGITVTVAEKMTKTVPVETKFIGNVPSGYEAEVDVSMDHATVTVSGPKETIEKITYAEIAVDLTGKMATFADHYPLTLCGIDKLPIADDSYVTVNLDTIRAVVQVYQMKRVPLQILPDLTDSGLQEDMFTIITRNNLDTVTLIGNGDALAQVDEVLLVPIILKDYNDTTTIVWAPELPTGVRCKETVEIQLKMPEMETRVLTVDQYRLINVPEGMTVNVTESFDVTIRGPKEILDQITAADVVGIVDCANANLNSVYASVTYRVEGHDYLYVRGVWETVFIQVLPADDVQE